MFQLCLQLIGLQILCCLVHCNPALVLAGKVVSKFVNLMAEQIDVSAAQEASCCCFCATANTITTPGACQGEM